jgi:DNA replication protein DnaC
VRYQAKLIAFGGIWRDTSSGVCPECRRKELELERNAERKVEVLARKEQITKRRNEWLNLVIPPRYLDRTFKSFQSNRGNLSKIFKSCIDYAEKFPIDYIAWLKEKMQAYPSMFLGSVNYGTGKTHLACAIAHRIIDRWNGEHVACPVLVISEGDVYRQIQNTYSYDNKERQSLDSEADIVNRLQRVPLLVLDDIGKEIRPDLRFVQRIMFGVIDGRYKNNRPMIVTTNMSGEDLSRYLGAGTESACADRLVEMCRDNMWEIRAESYRLNPE